MKRGPSTKEEIDFVKKNKKKPYKEIAEKINRSEAFVKAILEPKSVKKKKNSLVKKEVVPLVNQEQVFPIKESFGRTKNAIVATPAMSEMSDDVKTKKGDPSCIFRINQLKK